MKLIKKIKENEKGKKFPVCYLQFEDSNLLIPIKALDKKDSYKNQDLLSRLAAKVENE